MQTNDGQSLEYLVRVIEGELSPRGFHVESRKPIYNEAGAQVAEFDIVITGNVGSAPLTCLIECRDRPSEGPAPGSWIEQLIGRRSRFRFDKVMAVSSTGFSAGAIEAATEAGIQLRRLDRLTAEAVAHWLPPNAPLVIREGRFHAVRLYLSVADEGQLGQCPMPVDQLVLFGADPDRRLPIPELWRELINQESVWRDVPEGGPPVERTVVAGEHVPEVLFADFRGVLIQIDRIEFDATLHAYFPVMPLVEAGEYSSAGADPERKQTHARLGRWKGADDAVISELVFIGYPKVPGASSKVAEPGAAPNRGGREDQRGEDQRGPRE